MKTSPANVLENVCKFRDITRIIRGTVLDPAVGEAFNFIINNYSLKSG